MAYGADGAHPKLAFGQGARSPRCQQAVFGSRGGSEGWSEGGVEEACRPGWDTLAKFPRWEPRGDPALIIGLRLESGHRF